MILWEKMKTPKFLPTSGSPTRTRKRVPISDIRHRKSYIVHRTSDIGHRTSDSGYRTSDVRNRTSDLRYQASASDIRHQKSEITHRTSNIGDQTSDIGHWTSNIRHRTSVRCPISDVRSPMSAVWCLTFDQWTLDIWNLYSSNFFFKKKKKLGLLASYSFEFNFGRGISLGFVGTFMSFYFPLLIVIHVSLARESSLGE